MKCNIENCNNEIHSKGFCRKHYRELCNKRDSSPEYLSWRNMKTRCLNKNSEKYSRYGGRGIKICKRWIDSFDAFLDDMGEKPFDGAQIDRIDSNGNYEPSNCRWTNQTINSRNRDFCKMSEEKVLKMRSLHKNKKIKQKDLANIFKISESQVSCIIRKTQWREINVG